MSAQESYQSRRCSCDWSGTFEGHSALCPLASPAERTGTLDAGTYKLPDNYVRELWPGALTPLQVDEAFESNKTSDPEWEARAVNSLDSILLQHLVNVFKARATPDFLKAAEDLDDCMYRLGL